MVLIWAGDKDDAGERIKSNIDIPYIDARPSSGKDIGELFASRGIEAVKEEYARYKLEPHPIQTSEADLEAAEEALTGQNRDLG